MAALFYSRALLSISMISLGVISILDWDQSRKFPLRFFSKGEKIKAFFTNPVFLPIALICLITLISGLWSEDTTYFLERLRLKVPYLFLPFAFYMFPKISKTQYHFLLGSFLLIIMLSTVPVLLNYVQNYEDINLLLKQGKAIPTPISHIRYSLCLAIAVITGIYLFSRTSKFYVRWGAFFIALYLFGVMHLLSVRSGLLALYVALAFLLLYFILNTKRYMLGIALLVGLISIPIIAINTVPSLKHKLDYTLWDWSKKGKENSLNPGEIYSDNDRMQSIKIGLSLWSEHKLLGIGSGDVKREMFNVYDERSSPKISYKLPHNQFVTVLLGSGLLGLVFFLLAIGLPLIRDANYQDIMVLGCWIIIGVSFLFENTIENSRGIAIHLLFLLLPLYFRKSVRKD